MSKQIIEAVHHCHKNGVIHKDIKPQNFLVTDDNLVLLTDFGAATKARLDDQYTTKTTTQLIEAPEMLHDESGAKFTINTKIDVWALGVCLYWLFNLQYPFDEGNIVKSITEEDPKPHVHNFDTSPQ